MRSAASAFTCPRDRVALESSLGVFRCPVCLEVWSAVKRWGRIEPDLSDEEVVVVESCGVGLADAKDERGPACRCRRQLGHAGGHYCDGALGEEWPNHHPHIWEN